MTIKFSSDLEKQFRENDKRIRTWATWKLKAANIGLDGEKYTIWDKMSKHDQDFNLAWNEIESKMFDVSLTKLKKILKIIKGAV